MELSGKLTGLETGASAAVAGSERVEEALAALNMLGFSKAAAEKVLRSVLRANPAASTEELVRLALKEL